jgi:hypothetical protein
MGWDLAGAVEYRFSEKLNKWHMFGKFDFGRNTDIQRQRESVGTIGVPDDISYDLLLDVSIEVREQPLPDDINDFIYRDAAEKAVKQGAAFWLDRRTESRVIFRFTSASWATFGDLEQLMPKLEEWQSIQKINSLIALMKALSSDKDNFCRIIFWLR